MPLSSETLDLIDRASNIPYGLQFVESAPPDCVASTLGVSPEAVMRARSLLSDAAGRLEFAQELERAARRRESGPPGPKPARGPEELIREAEADPLGISFLVEAPLETVAIHLKAHPFVVLGARALLERRGRGT